MRLPIANPTGHAFCTRHPHPHSHPEYISGRCNVSGNRTIGNLTSKAHVASALRTNAFAPARNRNRKWKWPDWRRTPPHPRSLADGRSSPFQTCLTSSIHTIEWGIARVLCKAVSCITGRMTLTGQRECGREYVLNPPVANVADALGLDILIYTCTVLMYRVHTLAVSRRCGIGLFQGARRKRKG